VLPHVYGFSTLGDPLQLIALVSVFTLATSFMGQAAGAWFKYPETPTLIFLATSLPQLFLTGFSWPCEAIPEAAQVASYIFPSRGTSPQQNRSASPGQAESLELPTTPARLREWHGRAPRRSAAATLSVPAGSCRGDLRKRALQKGAAQQRFEAKS
jgi:hypothetical protein